MFQLLFTSVEDNRTRELTCVSFLSSSPSALQTEAPGSREVPKNTPNNYKIID